MHAVHCLQTLFKSNNKAFGLRSLYHPIFPSFLTNPRPDIQNLLFLNDSEPLSKEFFQKAVDEIKREPTLFYLIRSVENGFKFRTTVCSAISTLLEYSELSKWYGVLE
jgi:hypothetical protein